ncbi:MAG TPA: ATP-binding cassette domain-containing protein [Saprospiraceae bacterium]|nr:ATP-binding cassette domain-containing protein [Saprospiraceae bacterium]
MSLKVENINFGYKENTLLLRNISFEIEQGKTLGIVGVSGTGKSTLLKLIASFSNKEQPTEFTGSISFNNLPIENLKQIGKFSFMFQEPTLMPNLSVYDNIKLPSKILGTDEPNDLNETINLVGLSAFVNAFPYSLSGGMKTRVSMARSFITDPDLLLLDEPFSALDIGWKSRLYNELSLLQKKHSTTIVLVSHDIEEVLNISDKIIVLGCEGSLIYSNVVSNLQNKAEEILKVKNLVLDNHKTYFN